MTIDDDSLLSAYMDGQLGPDQQSLVESALDADPQLGEELRSLTAVRELLSGLPHPASADVIARVRDRIRGKSRIRKVLHRVPGSVVILRRPARAAGVFGIAAGLLLAVVLSFASVNRPESPHDPANPPVVNVASLLSSLTRPPASLEASESRWPLFPHSDYKGASSPSKAEVHRSKNSQHPAARSDALEHVSQYLDNPDLRQVFMVSDVMDQSAPGQVASVVEQTTRFNYYKITIAQGIVIDPRHPDEATVFALVVNPDELISLRDRLRSVFRDRFEEAPVDPKVVTQLADIGHVQACAPSPTADVVIPREALAIRTPPPEGVEPTAAEDPVVLGPTPEQERSSPAADLAATRAKAKESRDLPRPVEGPDQSFVVLVWVSRARPG